MQRDIGVHGIRIKALTDHEYRFLVLVPRLTGKRDVGCQGNIARGLLPDKLKGIGSGPHILATAGNCVSVLSGIVISGPGMKNGSDIRMIFEYTDLRGSRLRPQ